MLWTLSGQARSVLAVTRMGMMNENDADRTCPEIPCRRNPCGFGGDSGKPENEKTGLSPADSSARTGLLIECVRAFPGQGMGRSCRNMFTKWTVLCCSENKSGHFPFTDGSGLPRSIISGRAAPAEIGRSELIHCCIGQKPMTLFRLPSQPAFAAEMLSETLYSGCFGPF